MSKNSNSRFGVVGLKLLSPVRLRRQIQASPADAWLPTSLLRWVSRQCSEKPRTTPIKKTKQNTHGPSRGFARNLCVCRIGHLMCPGVDHLMCSLPPQHATPTPWRAVGCGDYLVRRNLLGRRDRACAEEAISERSDLADPKLVACVRVS